MKRTASLLLALFLAACGDDGSEAGEPKETPENFGETVAVAEGYIRYYSSLQELDPGDSLNLVEWVAPAFDRDVDVIDIKGAQTAGGHHVLMMVSPAVEKIGTLHAYENEDQLNGTLIGGIGGEGGPSIAQMPEGYVFRAYKGQGLYLQTHYINVTRSTIKVRSYLDVQLADASPERKVVSVFANTTLNTAVPPNSHFTYTAECETQEDLSFLMFANHMHEHGTAIHTEALLPNGEVLVIKDDPVWNVDWQFDANYTFAFDAPVELPKGSKLRTSCTWDNTSDRALGFPDEMCVFYGYRASEHTLACTDGSWRVNDARATNSSSTDTTPVNRLGAGACSNDADFAAFAAARGTCMARLTKDVAGCAVPLLNGDAQCIVDCFEEAHVSTSCGECYGDFMKCNAQHCAAQCSGDPKAEACVSCQKTNCCATFEGCSGVSC